MARLASGARCRARPYRFVLFGNASHDAPRSPFVGLYGKALFIETDTAGLSEADRGDLCWLDATLARRDASADFFEQPSSLATLAAAGHP